ncbi:MAG TPA: LamG domain-containing protein [Fimbriimonas sp.]|nr:LamG domain-containing protein [Fimbriimonas sp.]
MPILAALSLFTALSGSTTPALVASWSGDGTYADRVSGMVGRPMGGTTFVPGPPGISKKAFDFDGENSVVFIRDDPKFQLSKGLTISCWVFPRALPKYGNSPQAPLIFRGDDRDGLDPYVLYLMSDGTWKFLMNDSASRDVSAVAPAQINCWTHLCGTWDGAAGVMKLYINGKLAVTTKSDIHPMDTLDIRSHPGLSIGNVQNPFGDRSFQPFNGSIADVKIYNGPLAKPDFTRLK